MYCYLQRNIPISNQLLSHMQFVTTSFNVQDDLDGTVEFVKCFYSLEKRYMQVNSFCC